jgi:hypothetical protein
MPRILIPASDFVPLVLAMISGLFYRRISSRPTWIHSSQLFVRACGVHVRDGGSSVSIHDWQTAFPEARFMAVSMCY